MDTKKTLKHIDKWTDEWQNENQNKQKSLAEDVTGKRDDFSEETILRESLANMAKVHRDSPDGKLGQQNCEELCKYWRQNIMQILNTKFYTNIEDKKLYKYWSQNIMQTWDKKYYANILKKKKNLAVLSLNLLLSNKWKIKCFPMGMITDHTKCCANIGFSEQMKWGLQ